MFEVHGYAAQSATTSLVPFSFFRRDVRPNDVRVDILFSGVCHSDMHTAHGHWDGSIYPNGPVFPCVPGHEIVGRVVEVGADVLKLNGAMVLVGISAQPHPSPSAASLIGRRRSLAGSNVGGILETQEMLDFCAQHEVVADTEMISIQQIEMAYARMLKNDVKYRFVIDMASLRSDPARTAKEN